MFNYYLLVIIAMISFRSFWKKLESMIDMPNIGYEGNSRIMNGEAPKKSQVQQAARKVVPKSIQQAYEVKEERALATAGGAIAGVLVASKNAMSSKDNKLKYIDENGQLKKMTAKDIINKSTADARGTTSKIVLNRHKRTGLGLWQTLSSPMRAIDKSLADELTNGGRTADSVAVQQAFQELKIQGINLTVDDVMNDPKIGRLLRQYARDLKEFNLTLYKVPKNEEEAAKIGQDLSSITKRLSETELILRSKASDIETDKQEEIIKNAEEEEKDRLRFEKIQDFKQSLGLKRKKYNPKNGISEEQYRKMAYTFESQSTMDYKQQVLDKYEELGRLIRQAEIANKRAELAIKNYKKNNLYDTKEIVLSKDDLELNNEINKEMGNLIKQAEYDNLIIKENEDYVAKILSNDPDANVTLEIFNEELEKLNEAKPFVFSEVSVGQAIDDEIFAEYKENIKKKNNPNFDEYTTDYLVDKIKEGKWINSVTRNENGDLVVNYTERINPDAKVNTENTSENKNKYVNDVLQGKEVNVKNVYKKAYNKPRADYNEIKKIWEDNETKSDRDKAKDAFEYLQNINNEEREVIGLKVETTEGTHSVYGKYQDLTTDNSIERLRKQYNILERELKRMDMKEKLRTQKEESDVDEFLKDQKNYKKGWSAYDE